MASRVAASLLLAAGLPDTIAADIEEYEQLALRLASHPDELQRLKHKLHANRATAPLFDTERFVRQLEDAYLGMWQRFNSGAPPQSFAVPPRAA